MTYKLKAFQQSERGRSLIANARYRDTLRGKRFRELRETINSAGNCGVGAGGFQPGNTCAKGGSPLDKLGQADLKGLSVTDVKEERVGGVSRYVGRVSRGQPYAYRAMQGKEFHDIVEGVRSGRPEGQAFYSRGKFTTDVERIRPGAAATMFSTSLSELIGEAAKRHGYDAVMAVDLAGLEFVSLRKPVNGRLPADLGLGAGIVGSIPVDRIKAVWSLDYKTRQIKEEVTDSIPGRGLLHNAFCPTGPGGGVDPTCSPRSGNFTRTEGKDRSGKPDRDDVLNIVADVRDRWGYKGSMSLVDGQGEEFERGGLRWKKAGECRTSGEYAGAITIWRDTDWDSTEAVERLVAHEMMHGTYQRVKNAYDQEQYQLMEYQLRADGKLLDEYRDQFPTYARFWAMYQGSENPKVGDDEWFQKDDGISEYSRAYWRDYEAGKCSLDTAVHETLAEIAGYHEATGKILGSKRYRDFYKALRDEYRVMTGQSKRRKGPGVTKNEVSTIEHEMYLDSKFKPTPRSKASWLRYWMTDGRTGLAQLSKTPTTNKKKPAGKPANPLRLDPSHTGALRKRFEGEMGQRFDRLKKALWKLVVEEDALGLRGTGLSQNAFCATGEGGGIDPTCSPGSKTGSRSALKAAYPMLKTGEKVGGLDWIGKVSNLSSVSSSLDKYEFMPGIRAVDTSLFEAWTDPHPGYVTADDLKHVERLKARIQQTGRVEPLIVVVDKEGPYILEGGHRYEALRRLGVKYLPAKVVIDRDSLPDPTLNAFCPTGEGGGRDNSCSPRPTVNRLLQILNGDCGTGVGGFKPGNTCGKGGGKTADITGGFSHFRVMDESAKALAEMWDPPKDVLDVLNKEDGIIPDDPERAKEAFVYHAIRSWQGFSGGVVHREIVKGAIEASGVETYQVRSDKDVDQWFQDHPGTRDALADLGRAMYQTTQDWLRKNGVKSLKLYRKGSVDRPFSSWTTEPGWVRQEAAGSVVTQRIPAKFIMSIPATGFGSRDEYEVVVIGSRKKAPTTNAGRWAFLTSSKRLEEFVKWFKLQLLGTVLEPTHPDLLPTDAEPGESWLTKYVRETYKKSLETAHDLMKPTGVTLLPTEAGRAYQAGGKAQFMRQAFNGPAGIERLRQLAGRAYDDLEGVSTDLSNKISRELLDGMVKGEGPRAVGRRINKMVDGYKNRGLAIARTECLPAETLVDTAVVRAVFRRPYVGPMVEVKTGNGRKFSATPNHPMLTSRGWVAAGELQVGDDLISNGWQKNSSSTGDPHVQGRPTTLGEIFSSLQAVGIVERKPTTDMDFHGDGTEGEVEVLRLNRPLTVGRFTPLDQPLAEKVFTPTGLTASSFCSVCSGLLPVNHSNHVCPGSARHVTLSEASFDNLAGDPEGRSNVLHELSFSKSPSDIVSVDVPSVLVSDSAVLPGQVLRRGKTAANPGLTQDGTDGLLVDTDTVCNSSLTEPGQVQLDNVTSLRLYSFTGHVYNLETECGYYTISSLYTGNTLRAHNEGQLDGLEALGATHVGAQVEWSTSGLGMTALGNPSPCPLCAELQGLVLTIQEARGLLPRHPNCFIDPLIRVWASSDGGTTQRWTPISQIEEGYHVLTHRGNWKPVIQIHRNLSVSEKVVRIFCEGAPDPLEVTASHPVYRGYETWLPAENVQVGDTLLVWCQIGVTSVQPLKVWKVEHRSVKERLILWNLSVADDESYIVSLCPSESSPGDAGGYIVHNCMCAWRPANVGESTKGQIRRQDQIKQALERSLRLGKPKKAKLKDYAKMATWPGGRAKIGKTRPKTFTVHSAGGNCGTGAGGFKPGNTCSRPRSSSVKAEITGVGPKGRGFTKSFRLSDKAAALYDDPDWLLSNDILTVVDGHRYGGFTENPERAKPSEVKRAEKALSRHGLSGEVELHPVRGGGLIAVRFDANGKDKSAFVRAASKYLSGGAFEMTDDEERLMGRMLGFPLEGTEWFLRQRHKK